VCGRQEDTEILLNLVGIKAGYGSVNGVAVA
jgi:hypothetical protein